MTIAFAADANVIVSAQLVQHPEAPYRRVYEAIFDDRFQHYVTTRLLAEYRDVLLRPTVQSRHRLTHDEVRRVVDSIGLASLELSPPRAIAKAPDRGDQHLWDLLAGYPEVRLVTGDPLLLSSDHFPTRVLSPRRFVEDFLTT
ncbi:MAG: putative toxin-antitoxin system toxin component, PIN family [Dehalococcoidia bacterium]